MSAPVAKKPKNILNDPKHAVSEFIDGLLYQYPNQLRKLQNHHVVLATNAFGDDAAGGGGGGVGATRPKVHLISGGGSGHEPSHAGWLDGNGMLSGAVCGGIFASPSVHAVLAAIRAIAATAKSSSDGATKPSVLLVVKNYTGDRLNFGMAAEKALQEGIDVEMVVVADDCALSRTKGITGARGVAGTVLVHKIAGAAAASGLSLQGVCAVAKSVCQRMGSLGITLDSVTIPGSDTVNDRLNDTTIEIGLGIHGESGMKQAPLMSSDEMAKEMISTIQTYGRVRDDKSAPSDVIPMMESGDEVCVLVNNLGGTSNFELSILARSCVSLLESPEYNVKVTRVLVGSYMTSFNMHGASLTILNVTNQPDLVKYLDASTNAPAWNTVDIWNTTERIGGRPSSVEIPEIVVDEKTTKLNLPPLSQELGDFASIAKAKVTSAATKLEESEPILTKYDTIVGDGDCGITMKRGASEVLKRLADGTITTAHPVTMFSQIADAVSASMGGTSGILIEMMFRKISSTLSRCDGGIGKTELSNSIQTGVEAVCLYGGATIGSRTMLDALIPASTALVATNGDVKEAATKARAGADGTAQMKSASAGRSNYLSEEALSGTPDPGAVAVAIVLEAISD